MPNFLAPLLNDQQVDANGAPLSGGTVEVYLAGTSTPSTTYSDQAGLAPNTWPIVLNTLGVNNQGAVWLNGGSAYKYVIKDSTGVVQRTLDNISGINDSAPTFDQWVLFLGQPTFVSSTSFTVDGDQTQIFQARRRLRTSNTGGVIYSTVVSSVYSSPNTTVTVTNDSGVLDSGLSQVYYGIISPLDTSLPAGLLVNVQTFTASGTYTPTPGVSFIVVEGTGGGGGGGGATNPGVINQASTGGGGSAGAFGRGKYPVPAAPVTVTIGAAGSAAVNTPGGSGGTTSFGSLLTCPGGGGGAVGVPSGTAQGSGGQGNISGAPTGANVYGSSGHAGQSGRLLGGQVAQSGAGADSPFGSGGGGINSSGASGVTGRAAAGYGSGGGGGIVTGNNGASASGGAGAPGIVIVYEFA